MADVSLDDLIKKDKEKSKPNKVQKSKPTFNKPNHFPNKNHNDRNDWQSSGKGNHPSFKNKPIRKQFQGKPQRPQVKQRENTNQAKKAQQQNNQQQRRQRQLRTLKVLGISPQFTNEDLFKLFAAEGSMEKCLIEVDNFGRSLTTAIVQYHQTEAVQNAIRNLNGHKIKNGVLTVQPYKSVKK